MKIIGSENDSYQPSSKPMYQPPFSQLLKQYMDKIYMTIASKFIVEQTSALQSYFTYRVTASLLKQATRKATLEVSSAVKGSSPIFIYIHQLLLEDKDEKVRDSVGTTVSTLITSFGPTKSSIKNALSKITSLVQVDYQLQYYIDVIDDVDDQRTVVNNAIQRYEIWKKKHSIVMNSLIETCENEIMWVFCFYLSYSGN